MPSFTFLRRVPIGATMLITLLLLARSGALGQSSKASPATPVVLPVAGTGEQMRAIAVICDLWEANRRREAKTGGKQVRSGAAQDSSDIRDYDFEVTQESTTFKITLRPKKPVVEKIVSPQGTYLLNNSSTFFYEVRRSDFKIVGASAIL